VKAGKLLTASLEREEFDKAESRGVAARGVA